MVLWITGVGRSQIPPSVESEECMFREPFEQNLQVLYQDDHPPFRNLDFKVERRVIGEIVEGMVGAAAVEVSRISITSMLELHGSILYDHTQRLDALPPTLVADIDRDVRELYTKSGARPMLALEAWAGHVDTRMTDMPRARYDDHRLIHDMLVQQPAMQCELREMRGRVTALEQKRDCREQ
ncbi:hypothetical protein Tco_1531794 [Tanacetum coccineum]